MTKRALISTAELKRMADIANAKNVTVEIEFDDTIIRVIPFHPSQTHERFTREEKADQALAKWKAKTKLPDDFAL